MTLKNSARRAYDASPRTGTSRPAAQKASVSATDGPPVMAMRPARPPRPRLPPATRRTTSVSSSSVSTPIAPAWRSMPSHTAFDVARAACATGWRDGRPRCARPSREPPACGAPPRAGLRRNAGRGARLDVARRRPRSLGRRRSRRGSRRRRVAPRCRSSPPCGRRRPAPAARIQKAIVCVPLCPRKLTPPGRRVAARSPGKLHNPSLRFASPMQFGPMKA